MALQLHKQLQLRSAVRGREPLSTGTLLRTETLHLPIAVPALQYCLLAPPFRPGPLPYHLGLFMLALGLNLPFRICVIILVVGPSFKFGRPLVSKSMRGTCPFWHRRSQQA